VRPDWFWGPPSILFGRYREYSRRGRTLKHWHCRGYECMELYLRALYFNDVELNKYINKFVFMKQPGLWNLCRRCLESKRGWWHSPAVLRWWWLLLLLFVVFITVTLGYWGWACLIPFSLSSVSCTNIQNTPQDHSRGTAMSDAMWLSLG
jgi:hypothetical protein